MKKVYIYAAIAAIVGLALAYLAGFLLPDRGNDRLILRIGLTLIVILAVAAFIFFKRLQEKSSREGTAARAKPLNSGDELELLLRDAETKLAAARLAQGSRLSDYPAIFVIGPEGAAKTTTVIQSGTEPELLAGQVFRESAVTPTRLLNVWFARKALFVEPGAQCIAAADSWIRLVRRITPGKLGSVTKKAQAARAALVCIEAERFLQPGAAEAAVTSARSICEQLTQISRALGVSTPVYVLFTKIDRIPFFQEYVQNLRSEEAGQVLGVTLPIRPASGKGPYAEEQTAFLTQQFNRLLYSLCDHRPEYLASEKDNLRAAAIYEFPREFRKLRPSAVSFLVEVCRPSQLTIGPFLRGFYFSGVRPVIVQEAAYVPAARPVAFEAFQSGSEATSMFRLGQKPAQAPSAEAIGASPTSKKVPQWVFLTKFFQNILLADDRALGISGTSVKTSSLRKTLLASATALCLLLTLAFTVSYVNNRNLETSAVAAANGINANGSGEANRASLDSLERLETLRQALERLTGYERNGVPLSLQWGFYTGHRIYPRVREIYFQKFQQLLLSPTQNVLLAELNALPATPGPGADYQHPYDTLKSYLITTSHHEKSTKAYLAPVLQSRWEEKHTIEGARSRLAQRQFDYYSQELALANPFSSAQDGKAIDRGRQFLSGFKGVERIYQSMLADASASNPPVNFNRQFPGSAQEVVNDKDVSGAFTKGGWNTMQNALKNMDRFFNGEPWVLGAAAAQQVSDRAALEASLRERYASDFAKTWREYLKRSSVVAYKNLADAAAKLTVTSGSSSPLLALFWTASQNVAADGPDGAKNFKALYSVMPPASADYVGPGNKDYMTALQTLQSSIEQTAAQPGPPTDTSAAPVLAAAKSAQQITKTMALAFGTDPAGPVIQKLLEDPITQVVGLLKGLGPAELNGKGKQLCEQFRQVTSKYPFNPAASAPATLENVNGLFRPKDGALWAFYTANLQKLLVKQGSAYVADPAATAHVTPAFLAFFNRAAAFSDAAYAGGATDPHLTFTVKPVKAEGTDGATFTVDGQTLTSSGDALTPKPFVWSGSSHEAKVGLPLGDITQKTGLWAIFKVVGTADKVQQTSSSTSIYDWIFRTNAGPVMLKSGNGPITIRYELDMGSNPPIFQKGYLAGLSCVAEVAK